MVKNWAKKFKKRLSVRSCIGQRKYKNVIGVITNKKDTNRTINGEIRYFTVYTVSYDVNGKEYSFEFNKLWYYKKRNIGETIYLMYDIDNPKIII